MGFLRVTASNYDTTDKVKKYNDEICDATQWYDAGAKSTGILNKMKKQITEQGRE